MKFRSLIQPIFSFSKNKQSDFYINIKTLIDFDPININYYKEAFTHPSTTSNNNKTSFERLEFLGDSVLNTIIADYFFDEKPNENEGYLTQLRSKIVSRNNLNEIGEVLKLEELILNSDANNLGKNIHGNLLESLIGAIFKDLGYEKCESFVHKIILNKIDLTHLEQKIISYKSYIYEWSQKNKNKIEFITNEEENAEDITIFVSNIKLNDVEFVRGRAASKKQAEENASKRAYYSLQAIISKDDKTA